MSPQPYMLRSCIFTIEQVAKQEDRDLSMPGNPRYQPDKLKPYFGYDQWVLWLATVEVQWLSFLCDIKHIDGPAMTEEQISGLFFELRTRNQDILEKTTGHDINALIAMMQQSDHVPEHLKRFVHHGLTSYDTIETARALQTTTGWDRVLWPSVKELDTVWRQQITDHVNTFQMGRTHLQDALPVTIGLWLAVIHDRLIWTAREAHRTAKNITGKISGAVGTSASLYGLGIIQSYKDSYDFSTQTLEEHFLNQYMGLSAPGLSTQIIMPERSASFFFQLSLLSGSLAQLGEDARILQSSRYAELKSISSTSSTMAHKTGNPIAAENMRGMHTTVLAELWKVLQNLISDLQRDLCGSSPARDYLAIMIYVQQQIQTSIRLLKNMIVDEARCHENAQTSAPLVMAELLFLSLAKAGLENAHKIVNEQIVPLAAKNSISLISAAKVIGGNNPKIIETLNLIPVETATLIESPQDYLGDAVERARRQSHNSL